MLTDRFGRPMMEPMGTLGTYVRYRRVKVLGRTLQQVSDKSGLTKSAIAMIERGERRDIKADTVMKLAVGLDDSPENLLRAANGETPPPTED